MAYIIETMNVKSMAEALEKVKTVIIPVGVVEQHGYHLPLSTDILNVTEVLKRAADRLDAFIAPALPYSYSGGELPGTVNISPHLFSLFVADLCMEFARMGFVNIVVFLGHGGTDNTQTLRSALKLIYKKNPHMKNKVISLVECWELSPTWMDIFYKEHEFHAERVETSLMMYWRPELVGEIALDDPEIVKNMMTDQDWFERMDKDVEHRFVIPKPVQREEIKVGVMGHPEKASRELGELISKEMEEGIINFITLLNNGGQSADSNSIN